MVKMVAIRRVLTRSTIWRADRLGWILFFGVFFPKTGSRKGFWVTAFERSIMSSSQTSKIDASQRDLQIGGSIDPIGHLIQEI